jgi:Zn-dependent protease with chaperone function
MLKIQKKTYSWRAGLFMAATAISTTVAGMAPAQAQFGKLSEADEIRAGQQAAQQAIREFGQPLPASHPMSRRVRAIGARFAALSGRKNIPYSYTVLQNNNVLNAFAAPGGPIFVTTKLVQTTSNDAELAYVIGHETAHIDRRHIAESIQKQQQVGLAAGILGAIIGRSRNANILGTAVNLTATLWARGYSRDHETESDTVGVRWMSRLGYDPRASISMMAKLGGGGGGISKYLSTHPDPKSRQRRVSEIIQKENLLDVARRAGGPRLTDAGSGYNYASNDYPVDGPTYTETEYPNDVPNYGTGSLGREVSLGTLLTVERGGSNIILAPVAGVANWANAQVSTNGAVTTVRRGNTTLELRRNSTVAYANNRTRELAVAPQIYQGRLYAPLGDLVEGLGGTATYDAQNNVARVSINGQSGYVRLS